MSLSHINIINLEDIVCPRIDQLHSDDGYPTCLFHMNLSPKQHCTFYKMFTLRNWF